MMMFDYVNLLVEFVVTSVSILSPKDNYDYTISLSPSPLLSTVVVVVCDCVDTYDRTILIYLYVGK